MDAFRRISSLVRKEYNQLIRDRSSLVIGIVIPIMLILLIGYGLSLDVKNVPVAVVMEDASPTVQDMLSFMDGSDYFDPRYTTSRLFSGAWTRLPHGRQVLILRRVLLHGRRPMRQST